MDPDRSKCCYSNCCSQEIRINLYKTCTLKKKKKKRLVHWPGHNHILEDSLDMKTFSSVTQSCPTLCYPIDCSTPGLPVHHQLPEPTQTRVH